MTSDDCDLFVRSGLSAVAKRMSQVGERLGWRLESLKYKGFAPHGEPVDR